VLRVPPEQRDIADIHVPVPVPSEAPPRAERTEQARTAGAPEAQNTPLSQPAHEPVEAPPQAKPNANPNAPRQNEQIGALDEVIVAAAPAQPREKDSPSPVAVSESGKSSHSTGSDTKAITSTTSARPEISGLFSRQDSSASAPVAAPFVRRARQVPALRAEPGQASVRRPGLDVLGRCRHSLLQLCPAAAQ
jgi:hypothetical protein